MKNTRLFGLAAAGLTAVAITGAADAGVMNYSWQASSATAEPGDTVTMTLHVDIDPQGGDFYGLAASAFSINISDVPAGGTIVHTGSGLNLHPGFAGLGSPGTINGASITGIQAAQLPLAFNPGANQSTQLALYSFTYTIDDAAMRDVVFSANITDSKVFTNAMGMSADYTAQTTPYTLSVTAIPAPGALALLGAAALIGLRRRRTA